MAGGETSTGGGAPLVACVGDVMLDVRVSAPAIARGGDVPGSISLVPGGGAANVAVWARAAGAAARVVACTGDDPAGALLRAALEERGVELSPAGGVAGATGTILVLWEAGERSFVADPGANLALRTRHVNAGLDGASAVYVSGYQLVRPASRRAAMAAARRCGPGRPGTVDAASWPLLAGSAGRAVLSAASAAGALLANADEAAALTGSGDAGHAARALADRVPIAVVKRGGYGVLVAAGGRSWTLAAEPVEVVDPTGAGDAFAAGFLVARVQGADPVEAARAGVAAAGRAVAVEGPWPPLPRA